MYRFSTMILVALLAVPSVAAAEVDYLKQIKPLLAEKCHACHGVLKQESNLRLDSRQFMVEGGDSGEAINTADPQGSLILERIQSVGSDRMPPQDQGTALSDDQIALIRAWIEQGAIAPEESVTESPEQHWAFQRVTRPAIASKSGVPDDSASNNPIDQLLRAKHVARSIKAQGPAERSLQIRRLYLDLIGLPPTAEQQADSRPWSVIVDDLLGKPQHGERWARHWMDIWRYSDWYGLGAQLRNSQKHLWHWRDWIIDSVNRDKGYDQMILEMLAGDELSPNAPEAVTATGFLARNYYLFNRTTWLDSTIEHTSKAFLGLTINCAKCHDHKYDPISQLDYYRLRAVFEPHQVRLDPVPGVTNLESDGLPRVFDDDLSIATYLHVRGDPKNPDKDRIIPPGVPAIFERFAEPIEPVTLPADAYAPGVRDYVRRDLIQSAREEVDTAEKELTQAKQKLSQWASTSAASQTDSSDESKPVRITDDFEMPNPELWELVGDGWQYRDGALHQTTSTRDSQMVRLRHSMPRNFELNCRFTTTGGTTYKSVTFRFDQSPDGKVSNYVYTSAHGPGPKVQVAYARNGDSTYPPEGRRSHPIQVGQPYHLRFAVRGELVNVWLDDQFMVAYRFPDRRDGFLSLSGFDATVAFDSIEIKSLDSKTQLQEAGNKSAATPSDPKAVVALAEAKLEMTRAKMRSIEATLAADRAKFRKEDQEETSILARQAAKRQAQARVATAEHLVLVEAADAKKRQDAEKQLEAAKNQLASIQDNAAEYVSIKVTRKALESPAHKETDYPPTYSAISSGRRLALAKWITSRNNPLTARVAANHIWVRHFGTPLVDSVFDFGLRSPQPEHAELLDLLAWELMESGWSLKHLHRLIVNSEAYRRTSSSLDSDPGCLETDPDNQLYWRMNSRRMESQVVRDSLLELAGQLDKTMHGPSLEHDHQPARRSLYLKHSPNQEDKFLQMFDNADVLACYRRSESIVPQQALAMANSQLALSMAEKIAHRLQQTLSTDQPATDQPATDQLATDQLARFVDVSFQTLLGRAATELETAECLRFFETLNPPSRQEPVDAARLRSRFIHAILNHNDFITIR